MTRCGSSGVHEMADDDWMDKPLAPSKDPLSRGQMTRLMAMTDLLSSDVLVLQTVMQIKLSFLKGDAGAISQLWVELEEEEQQALWVAPSFGGIFTTAERTAIKTGVIEE
jgi:hypothetical protein